MNDIQDFVTQNHKNLTRDEELAHAWNAYNARNYAAELILEKPELLRHFYDDKKKRFDTTLFCQHDLRALEEARAWFAPERAYLTKSSLLYQAHKIFSPREGYTDAEAPAYAKAVFPALAPSGLGLERLLEQEPSLGHVAINDGRMSQMPFLDVVEAYRESRTAIINSVLKCILAIAADVAHHAGRPQALETLFVVGWSHVTYNRFDQFHPVKHREERSEDTFYTHIGRWIVNLCHRTVRNEAKYIPLPRDAYDKMYERSKREMKDAATAKKEKHERHILQMLHPKILSFDDVVGGKYDHPERHTYTDVIPDPRTLQLEQHLNRTLDAERVFGRFVPRIKDERVREIITLHYANEFGLTLEEIGDRYGGMSRERVRQLADRGVQTLRTLMHVTSKRENL